MQKKRIFSLALTISMLFCSIIPAAAKQETAKDYTISRNKVSYTEQSPVTAIQPQNNFILPEDYMVKDKNTGTAFPKSYSSVDLGYVSSIKNQGNLGSCWTFSAMGVLESHLMKKGYGEYDLSEEHLNHWATTRADNTGWQRSYTGGGFQSIPLGYFTSWQGPRLESDIPYRSGDNKTFEELDIGKTEVGVTQAKYIANDMAEIKSAITEHGGISTSYSTLSQFQNNDQTAVYCPIILPAGTLLDGHSITVVGWDDDYAKNNFNENFLPENNGAWLVKNSWGNYNRLNGYFWISYEDVYLFNKTVFGISYTVTDTIDITEKIKLYQNETYGSTYNLGLTITYSNGTTEQANNLTFINMFDFYDKYDALDSIVFESTADNADYRAFFIPVKNGRPDSDRANWTLLDRGTIAHKGYTCIDAKNFALPYDQGAIGITIDATNSEESCSMGCDEWLYNQNTGYRFIPNTKQNSSFLMRNGVLHELSAFYREYFDDDIGSNFVIKAIAKNDKTTAKKGDTSNDGEIDLQDIMIVQKHLTKQIVLTERNELYASDINYDGIVNLYDVIYMQRMIAKLPIPEFTC